MLRKLSDINVFPCCHKELPAPLDMVDEITCGVCHQTFKWYVVDNYNNMMQIIDDLKITKADDIAERINVALNPPEVMVCTVCGKMQHVNDFQTPDECSQCFNREGGE